MAVDPNRFISTGSSPTSRSRRRVKALGPGGKDAWLNLRIYDTTGRIFDGTNAHGSFDIKVERSDRQWFVHIGKPASTHVVEIGLKSYEGYFVKIVRSGRVDFPRFEPSSDGTVDWLTVRTSTGPVGDPTRGWGRTRWRRWGGRRSAWTRSGGPEGRRCAWWGARWRRCRRW